MVRMCTYSMYTVAQNAIADVYTYISGISRPRGQSTLPSARAVSEALIPDRNIPSQEFTLLLMQWGQFLDHDLTHTPLVKGENIGFCHMSHVYGQKYQIRKVQYCDCNSMNKPKY